MEANEIVIARLNTLAGLLVADKMDMSAYICNDAATIIQQQAAEIERLKRERDDFWQALANTYEIESRDEIEAEAAKSWNPPNPLVVALHYTAKRELTELATLRAVVKQYHQNAVALNRSLDPSKEFGRQEILTSDVEKIMDKFRELAAAATALEGEHA
jgi:uncharacterized protein YaaR (DUF327 family)